MGERISRVGTYRRERSGLVRSNRLIGWTLVVSCAAAGITWFFFVSGFWTVTTVETGPLQQLERGEVASTTFAALDEGEWKPWDRRNILLIDAGELARQLKERLFAEDVAVEKSYPHILRLKITERQRSVVLASTSQLLNVDTNGIVTGEATGETANQARLRLNRKALADLTHQPVVALDLPELAADGYQVADSATVKGWIEAYRALIASGMKFRYMSLTSPTSTAAYVTSDAGWQVIYDLGEPLGPQIETYQKFIRAKSKDLKIYEYVDVRIPGKIFVK